ncbi:MAG: tRNA epoxyqueuosine(34) reductase QueG [Gammaproteobacteria bacterium]|nr:tRNA epoxyqueuosine(34) reductase QueG [Gammaproteobacteria bacterium]
MKNIHTKIQQWSKELGFQQVGFSDIDLNKAEKNFQLWIEQKMHGEMSYMSHHGLKRSRPELLEAGTLSVISVRMDYLTQPASEAIELLSQSDKAYISRYALGRDYHKLMRKRLQQLANKIKLYAETFISDPQLRVFVDSAPVLEKPIAEKAGLGWIGKHTNLINQDAGSWFFLGEIYCNILLPASEPSNSSGAKTHCGSCTKCIDVCPTEAIIAPYQLDARKCISYLTIEYKGSIPLKYRTAIGNRIYGCDDCQLFCPWNKFASLSNEIDYKARHSLDQVELIELFNWSEADFLKHFEGSPIRRIGYMSWLRNIAIALGNNLNQSTNKINKIDANEIIKVLNMKRNFVDENVKEHIDWALKQFTSPRAL